MKKGFTLIELACVMVIIAILVSIVIPAIQKVFHGKSYQTAKAAFTLTRDAAMSDDIENINFELPMLEKPETNKVVSTNVVAPLKVSDYWDIKVETNKDSVVFTFYMKKPANSFKSFQTVSQNVIRIEYPK